MTTWHRFRSSRPRRHDLRKHPLLERKSCSCQTADPSRGGDPVRRTCRRPRRAHVRGGVRAWIKVKNPKAQAGNSET